MKVELKKIKNIAENNPIAIATMMSDNKPNIIAVAFAKVISEKEIIITDNFMVQTLKDLSFNNNVALIVWNKEWKGYKIIGKASYFTKGKWLNYVKKMKENKGLPAKGAVLIKVSKIIPSY